MFLEHECSEGGAIWERREVGTDFTRLMVFVCVCNILPAEGRTSLEFFPEGKNFQTSPNLGWKNDILMCHIAYPGFGY